MNHQIPNPLCFHHANYTLGMAEDDMQWNSSSLLKPKHATTLYNKPKDYVSQHNLFWSIQVALINHDISFHRQKILLQLMWVSVNTKLYSQMPSFPATVMINSHGPKPVPSYYELSTKFYRMKLSCIHEKFRKPLLIMLSSQHFLLISL